MSFLVEQFQLGRHDIVEPAVRELALQFPQDPFPWTLLSALLRAQQRNNEALVPLQKAVMLSPRDANLQANLGNLCRDLGMPAQAAECYQKALQLRPSWPDVLSKLGHMQQDLGQWEASESSFRQALHLSPGNASKLADLAETLCELGRWEEALACYQEALQLEPDNSAILYNTADLLHDLGRFAEAEAVCRDALRRDARLIGAHILLGTILKDVGKLDESIGCYRRALELQPDNLLAQSDLLFALNYLPRHDRQQCLKEAFRFGEMAEKNAGNTQYPWIGTTSDRPLRVGLVSGDLRNHPVGYFLENLVAHVDPEQLVFVAFSTYGKTDALSDRLRAYCVKWIELAGKSDEDASKLVQAEGIHVLLDLSGHTAHNRLSLFARRLAPVQASWLGYFATTGIAEMDFLIADPWTLPGECESDFVEKIWRLPETRLCFTPPRLEVPVSPLPALNKGYITFGCFNNASKLNDDVIALWGRLLLALPNSQLLLKAKQFGDTRIQGYFREKFAGHGIESHRLRLEGPTSRSQYLASYGEVDIGLDPFPFPGGTTTAESLWMGVPVLTLAGDRFLSRQGMGLIINAGLSDWVAYGMDEYLQKAFQYAVDLSALAQLRQDLRQQVLKSPVFDAFRFAHNFTKAMYGMWDQQSRA